MVTNANIYELGMIDAYQKHKQSTKKRHGKLGSIIEQIKQKRTIHFLASEEPER